MAKRNVFAELMESISEMKRCREGKLTLRRYGVEVSPLPKVGSKVFRDSRKKLRRSSQIANAR